MNTGKSGEERAARWLQGKGYRIIKRNFRTERGEVDLVASRSDVLVFCEVKTRLNKSFGESLEAIDQQKQKLIRDTAERFLIQYKKSYNSVRFDVITVYEAGNKAEITHIRNAF